MLESFILAWPQLHARHGRPDSVHVHVRTGKQKRLCKGLGNGNGEGVALVGGP